MGDAVGPGSIVFDDQPFFGFPNLTCNTFSLLDHVSFESIEYATDPHAQTHARPVRIQEIDKCVVRAENLAGALQGRRQDIIDFKMVDQTQGYFVKELHVFGLPRQRCFHAVAYLHADPGLVKKKQHDRHKAQAYQKNKVTDRLRTGGLPDFV